MALQSLSKRAIETSAVNHSEGTCCTVFTCPLSGAESEFDAGKLIRIHFMR